MTDTKTQPDDALVEKLWPVFIKPLGYGTMPPAKAEKQFVGSMTDDCSLAELCRDLARAAIAAARPAIEAQARAEERAVVLAMLPEAIMSQVFGLAQPDRGDVFSWLDDHKHQIVAGALLAIEQSQHTGEKHHD